MNFAPSQTPIGMLANVGIPHNEVTGGCLSVLNKSAVGGVLQRLLGRIFDRALLPLSISGQAWR